MRGRNNWSLGELLQALTILAHYHAVSSFVHGCRVVNDSSDGAGAAKTSGEYLRISPGGQVAGQ